MDVNYYDRPTDHESIKRLSPSAVARQLEYWAQRFALGSDVALTSLALTKGQVQRWTLPRIPVKDSDTRKAGFEQAYGQGAVELDALEALHPGELGKILREAARPYRDLSLSDRLTDAAIEAENLAHDSWMEATEDQQSDLDEIDSEARRVLRRYERLLRRLGDRLNRELGPIRGRLEKVQGSILDAADKLDIELPERPEAKLEPQDESEWLYKSSRDYMEQLRIYKSRRGKK